ncbi:MAG: hypothetical protein AAF801_07455 [Pseudomonadota bacterium]
MADIYIPVGPAELIDQMVIVQSLATNAQDLNTRTIYADRLSQMQALAADTLPPINSPSSAAVTAARHDVMQLEADMRAFEVRSDFGMGFVALSRAYLDALDVLVQRKAEYDAAIFAITPGSESSMTKH